VREGTHMDVDEAVDVAQVLAQGHLVLLLRLVHIAIQHLQHGVLAIHVALMALGNDLHVLPDLLQLAWTNTAGKRTRTKTKLQVHSHRTLVPHGPAVYTMHHYHTHLSQSHDLQPGILDLQTAGS
jgi:hypothetical protein